MTRFYRPMREFGWHVPEPEAKGVALTRFVATTPIADPAPGRTGCRVPGSGRATQSPKRARRNLRHRRGSVLVVALVCLLVMMTILSHMLLGSLRARRQLRPERDLRQTELLLEAGANRAVYRLATQSDYRGEAWHLPADSIVGSGDGDVTIAATRDSSDKPWQVRIVAEYPRGGQLPIRRSRTFSVPSQPPQKPQSQE
jgi:hypothetical protein